MSSRPARLTRRQFVRQAAQAGAALAVPWIIPGSALGKDGAVAPSERIVLGGIGLGGRGTQVLDSFLTNPDVQFVAICDVRKERREAIKQRADRHFGNSDCALYNDMRELLARPDIDAVLIATGDRWHTLASITAAKAGKDIFCEKPCSMTISESRALADTVRRYGRIDQAGTQRRSIENFLFAAELVASGKLGKLRAVHANERLRLLEATSTVASSIADISDRRFKAGDVAVLDVNLARAALARVRAEQEVAKASKAAALGELTVLLRFEAEPEVSGSLAESAPLNVALLEDLIARRPEILELEAALRAVTQP